MVWPGPVKKIRFSRIVFLCILLIALSWASQAQVKSSQLPFRISHNLIIIDASINGSDTLHFILDTGLKNSIICELSTGETLDLEEVREILVEGLGPGDPVEAYHSTGNVLEAGGIRFTDCDFVVLSNNLLQLSNKMGTKIHGMLSLKEFSDYVVRIDYNLQFIYLIHPEKFEKQNLKRFATLPLVIESGKPFVEIMITTNDGKSIPVKLLLDSGASNALWLDINSVDEISLPENKIRCYLGCGISGDVRGLIGRVKQVDIGPYSLYDVLVSFPDSVAIAQQEAVQGRNGSLGSDILNRFEVVLDIPGEQIFLRPNRMFSQPFHHDMSGIEVLARVPDQTDFLISRVEEGSPAFKAGVCVGDQILSINNTPASSLTMDKIYQNLLGSDGKKIRLQILREGEIIKLSFSPERII